MDILSRIYSAFYDCCTGLRFKEQRPTIDAVLRDVKALAKYEFNFVLKQYLKLHVTPYQVEYCCSPIRPRISFLTL